MALSGKTCLTVLEVYYERISVEPFQEPLGAEASASPLAKLFQDAIVADRRSDHAAAIVAPGDQEVEKAGSLEPARFPDTFPWWGLMFLCLQLVRAKRHFIGRCSRNRLRMTFGHG